jgi:ubiquinone/menaquinone biosynthesis C-methylase UbiE
MHEGDATGVGEASRLQARTADHYDSHPFEFLTAADAERIEEWQPRPFRRFVEGFLRPGQHVAEIGCGPGRGTLYLTRCGFAVIAVDISFASLLLARRRAPNGAYVAATNLQLPLRDESCDAVVSDGVIHHTPDALRAFTENVRVLKPGGHLYLACYKRYGYYYYAYTYLGAPTRWLAERSWGRALVHATLLPVYYLVHLVKSGGKRTWRGARHFFYDYLITPRASFHSRNQIEDWCRIAGLCVLEYDPALGNVHAFILRKNGPSP